MSEPTNTKNLKEFDDIINFTDDSRILGIGNVNIGNGVKFTISTLLTNLISPISSNSLSIGADGKLYSRDYQSEVENINEEINDINSSLSTKANSDGSNLDISSVGVALKGQITGYSAPSNRYTNISWADNATYTAPADGWYVVWGQFAEGGFAIFNTTTNLGNSCFNNSGATNYGKTSMPVKKGQTIQTYRRGGTVNGFRFVYAEGAQ